MIPNPQSFSRPLEMHMLLITYVSQRMIVCPPKFSINATSAGEADLELTKVLHSIVETLTFIGQYTYVVLD